MLRGTRDGLTNNGVGSVLGTSISINSVGLTITGVSNTSTSSLQGVTSAIGTRGGSAIIILTDIGNKGLAFYTTYNGSTITGNTRTNGLVHRVTGLANNGNNKGPSGTVTNNGSATGTSRTLGGTVSVLGRVLWFRQLFVLWGGHE